MKKITFIFILLPILAICQNELKSCETLSKINALIQKTHYKPKTNDDSLSVFVFDNFIDDLDDNHKLFLESEITALKKHRLKIDDYINDKNCTFLTEIYTIYNKSLTRYQSIIDNIKSEPFGFSSKESIKYSKKTFPFFKTDAELKIFYKKIVLFDILSNIAQTSKNKDSLVNIFDKITKTTKDKVFEAYVCKTADYQLTKTDFDTKFFNVFCRYFDPHTQFFTKTDKSSFLTSVSADNLSYGLMVRFNEKDELQVEEIIPGSAAYFSDKITAGDQIIKINANNQDYAIGCATYKIIEDIFGSNKYTQANFTFHKKTGLTYTVNLTKTVLKDYSNSVYSYIIENEDVRVGYLKIPSFYATLEDGKTNVSDDVVKEIYKLKADKIEGLIIDLQDNGGGSMIEVVNMSGLFIDAGPLALINDRTGKIETIKDPNRGTIYNGPLVVLINGFSASASEFFANVMQDYKRAVIVGNQSYGKASMQQIYPLDDKDSEDFVKITSEKFYRITGNSNQTIGNSPDVAIDALFDKQIPREKANKTALVVNPLAANLRYDVLQNPKRDIAIQNSKKRLIENQDAKIIISLNIEINKLYDSVLPDVLLNFDAVFASVHRLNNLWNNIESLSQKEYPIKVLKNEVDLEYQQFDDYLKKSNIDKIKIIKSNLHIFEATNIIKDLKN